MKPGTHRRNLAINRLVVQLDSSLAFMVRGWGRMLPRSVPTGQNGPAVPPIPALSIIPISSVDYHTRDRLCRSRLLFVEAAPRRDFASSEAAPSHTTPGFNKPCGRFYGLIQAILGLSWNGWFVSIKVKAMRASLRASATLAAIFDKSLSSCRCR